MEQLGCATSSGCRVVEIVRGYQKLFYINLFLADTKAPFDLDYVTAMSVAFPGANGTPVVVTYASSGPSDIAIIGAPGAGMISVLVNAANSALLRLNPFDLQPQDIQVEVTVGSGNASVPAGTSPFILSGVLNVVEPPMGVIVP